MGRYGADVMDEKCSSNKNIFCVKISFVIVADAYPYLVSKYKYFEIFLLSIRFRSSCLGGRREIFSVKHHDVFRCNELPPKITALKLPLRNYCCLVVLASS